MAARRRLEDRMRRVLHAFNFGEVQTPTFEELELFLAKSGEGIKEEIYHFKDKAERELCLRPELTAPVMRFYFSQLRASPKPLRLLYFGPCYRYDRPQSGRYREFWQVGVEVIGDASPEAHAELLWLALRLFQEAGLQNITLRVGHLAVLRTLMESLLGIPPTQQSALMRLIDKKELATLKATLLERRVPGGAIDEFLRFFDLTKLDDVKRAFTGSATTQAAYAHLERVFALLQDFGAPPNLFRFDPTIARGLEYYTGLVFELDCPDLGAEKQLLGGGEYDLRGVFDAKPEPTIGFALGFDRTLVALERGRTAPATAERVDAVVVALVPAAVTHAQRVAGTLRDLDLRVELDLAGRGPKKALQHGSAIHARTAVLLGERELGRGVATLKNLDSGEQIEAPLSEVPQRIAPWLQAA